MNNKSSRVNESTYSRMVQGIKCCMFGGDEVLHCRDCPYLGYGCGEKLKEDLLYFLDFFSTVDGWIEALGLKRFVIGGKENE